MKLLNLLLEEQKQDGYIVNIEKETVDNKDYRRVLNTTESQQLVVMSIPPGEEIGEEQHNGSQFIRIESGTAKLTLNGEEFELKDNDSVTVPRNVKHNIVNVSEDEDLKLYAIYSPPQHADDLVQKTKQDKEHVDESISFVPHVNAPEAKILNVFKNPSIGGKTKVSKQKVVVRDTKTGKIYTERGFVQKTGR